MLKNLGAIMLEQDDKSKAEFYFQSYLTNQQKYTIQRHDDYYLRLTLVSLAYAQGDLIRIGEYNQQDFNLNLTGKSSINQSLLFASLSGRAELAYISSDFVNAERWFLQAFDLIKRYGQNDFLYDGGYKSDLLEIGLYNGIFDNPVRRVKSPSSQDIFGFFRLVGTATAMSLQDERHIHREITDSVWLALRDIPETISRHRDGVKLLEGNFYRRESIKRAYALNNLGAIAHSLHSFSKSEQSYYRSLDILSQLAPGSVSMACTLNNLGLLEMEQGNFVKAERYHLAALSTRKNLDPNSMDTAASCYNLATVFLKNNKIAKALPLALTAWNIVQLRGSAVAEDGEKLAFNEIVAEYADLLLRCKKAINQSDSAFFTFQQSHAQALLQILIQRKVLGDQFNQSLYNANRSLDRSWKNLSNSILAKEMAQQKLSKAKSKAESTLYSEEVNKASATIISSTLSYNQALKVSTDALKHLKLQIRLPEPLSVAQAKAVLPVDTLYLGYAVGEESHLFVLTHDKPLAVFTLALPEKKLRAQVEALRDKLADPNGVPQKPGYALFNTLLPKAVQALLPHYKRLLISPDGVLWEIPFAALNTSAVKLDCLGLQKPILYTPSINVFARSLKEPSRLKPGTNPVTLAAGGMIYNRKNLAKGNEETKSVKPQLVASLPGRG